MSSTRSAVGRNDTVIVPSAAAQLPDQQQCQQTERDGNHQRNRRLQWRGRGNLTGQWVLRALDSRFRLCCRIFGGRELSVGFGPLLQVRRLLDGWFGRLRGL